MNDRILVFTDLDGTLLDHRTYSFEPAQPALRLLRESGIPLIICTSKTRAEVEGIRAALGNTDPFVVENGGAVFVPESDFSIELRAARRDSGYLVVEMGTSYSRILSVFSQMKERLPGLLRGFSDMANEEVVDLSGLSLEEAARAKKREYDEPFVLDDPASNLDIVREIAESAGLSITRGRFFHLTGDNDKGRAVRLVKDIYARTDGIAPRSIGLGDSPNDLPLLENVDFPVLVQKRLCGNSDLILLMGNYLAIILAKRILGFDLLQNFSSNGKYVNNFFAFFNCDTVSKPGGRYEPSIRLDHLILAPGEGPLGWSVAVCELVERLTG